MKFSGQMTQCNPPMIDAVTALTGLVNTAALCAKYATQLGSWISLAQCLDQAY
jgi:hypothetical protein